MSYGGPERLHPMEALHEPPIDAQGHQLVQPGHQHPCCGLPDTENLGRLGIDGRGKILRVEAIL